MNEAPQVYAQKIVPVPFLDAESKNFERDYKFALLVFKGAMPREAAKACKMRPNHGYLLLCRWRKKAEERIGASVSDTLILRTIVAPDSVKDDWETILKVGFQKVAKTEPVAEK